MRETLIWLVKKVSFLKIFPPSLESSSWCSESILKIRLYLLSLFLLVQVGGLRFQTFVYQQKLSFGSISIYFGAMDGIKRFLFWCRAEQSKQASPTQLRAGLHPSIIPDNSSIYNNCICWKVLLLRK